MKGRGPPGIYYSEDNMSIIIADVGTFLFHRLGPDNFSKPTLPIQFDDVDIPALDLSAYV